MQQTLVFLISPVARVTPEENARIGAYVAKVESEGKKVYWPIRDTEQADPTGGLAICRANFSAIKAAHEIHIWYDESSGGSKFDMGIVFTLTEMLRFFTFPIVIANDGDLPETEGKSFLKVMRALIASRTLP